MEALGEGFVYDVVVGFGGDFGVWRGGLDGQGSFSRGIGGVRGGGGGGMDADPKSVGRTCICEIFFVVCWPLLGVLKVLVGHLN
jgi:hypothetical protein